MKKSIAFIFVLILTVSLISCAFAITCPNCGAECTWHYSSWTATGHWQHLYTVGNEKHVADEYVRTVYTWCTNCTKFDTHYFSYMWKPKIIIIPDILL